MCLSYRISTDIKVHDSREVDVDPPTSESFLRVVDPQPLSLTSLNNVMAFAEVCESSFTFDHELNPFFFFQARDYDTARHLCLTWSFHFFRMFMSFHRKKLILNLNSLPCSRCSFEKRYRRVMTTLGLELYFT